MRYRRSESRDRMISAAQRQFRELGYVGTTLSDVEVEFATPRESLCLHFSATKRKRRGRRTVCDTTRGAGESAEALVPRHFISMGGCPWIDMCLPKTVRAQQEK